MAKLECDGVRYALIGASGSAKNGKYYAVEAGYERRIGERFQYWPEAAMTYFGILVSPPDACNVEGRRGRPDVGITFIRANYKCARLGDGKIAARHARSRRQKSGTSVVAYHFRQKVWVIVSRVRTNRTGEQLCQVLASLVDGGEDLASKSAVLLKGGPMISEGLAIPRLRMELHCVMRLNAETLPRGRNRFSEYRTVTRLIHRCVDERA